MACFLCNGLVVLVFLPLTSNSKVLLLFQCAETFLILEGFVTVFVLSVSLQIFVSRQCGLACFHDV